MNIDKMNTNKENSKINSLGSTPYERALKLYHMLFNKDKPSQIEGYISTILTHSTRQDLEEITIFDAVNILNKLKRPYRVLSPESHQEYHDLLSSTINNTSLPLGKLINFSEKVSVKIASLDQRKRYSHWKEMQKEFYDSDFKDSFNYKKSNDIQGL